ncbi:hypothetical protein N9933_02390, partial [bacterium]|nr:hypothetical protein [bacterium]
MSESTIRKSPKPTIDPIAKDTIAVLTSDSLDTTDLEQVIVNSERIIEEATIVKEEDILPPEEILEDLRDIQLKLKNAKNKKDFLRKRLHVKKLKVAKKSMDKEDKVLIKELEKLEIDSQEMQLKITRIARKIFEFEIDEESGPKIHKLQELEKGFKGMKKHKPETQEEYNQLSEALEEYLGLRDKHGVLTKEKTQKDKALQKVTTKVTHHEEIRKLIKEVRNEKGDATKETREMTPILKKKQKEAKKRAKVKLKHSEIGLKSAEDNLLRFRLKLIEAIENKDAEEANKLRDIISLAEESLGKAQESVQNQKDFIDRVETVGEAITDHIQVVRQIDITENRHKTYLGLIDKLISGEAGSADLSLSVGASVGEGDFKASLAIKIQGAIEVKDESKFTSSIAFSVSVKATAKIQTIAAASAKAECGTTTKKTYKNADHFAASLANKISRIHMAFLGGTRASVRPTAEEIKLFREVLNRKVDKIEHLDGLSKEDVTLIVKKWRKDHKKSSEDTPTAQDLEDLGLVHPQLIIQILRYAQIPPSESVSAALAVKGDFSALLGSVGTSVEISDTWDKDYKKFEESGATVKKKSKSFTGKFKWSIDSVIVNFSFEYKFSTAKKYLDVSMDEMITFTLTFPSLGFLLTPGVTLDNREKALGKFDQVAEQIDKLLNKSLASKGNKEVPDKSEAKKFFLFLGKDLAGAVPPLINTLVNFLKADILKEPLKLAEDMSYGFGFSTKKSAGYAWEKRKVDNKWYPDRRYNIGVASLSASLNIPVHPGVTVDIEVAANLKNTWNEKLSPNSFKALGGAMSAIKDSDTIDLEAGKLLPDEMETESLWSKYVEKHSGEFTEMFKAIATGSTPLKKEVDTYAEMTSFPSKKGETEEFVSLLRKVYIPLNLAALAFRDSCNLYHTVKASGKDEAFKKATKDMEAYLAAKGALDDELKVWEKTRDWPHTKLKKWLDEKDKQKVAKLEEEEQFKQGITGMGEINIILTLESDGKVSKTIKVEPANKKDKEVIRHIYLYNHQSPKSLSDLVRGYDVAYVIGKKVYGRRLQLAHLLKQLEFKKYHAITPELKVFYDIVKENGFIKDGFMNPTIITAYPNFIKKVDQAASHILSSESFKI